MRSFGKNYISYRITVYLIKYSQYRDTHWNKTDDCLCQNVFVLFELLNSNLTQPFKWLNKLRYSLAPTSKYLYNYVNYFLFFFVGGCVGGGGSGVKYLKFIIKNLYRPKQRSTHLYNIWWIDNAPNVTIILIKNTY